MFFLPLPPSLDVIDGWYVKIEYPRSIVVKCGYLSSQMQEFGIERIGTHAQMFDQMRSSPAENQRRYSNAILNLE